jgi:iron complex transport system substrate-binding protein
LVGTDLSSIYPDDAANLPKVGVWRMVTPEAVLGLNPDLVLAMPDAGPPATIEKIEASTADLYKPEDSYSVAWTKNLINEVGALLDADEMTAPMIKEIENKEMLLDSLQGTYDREDKPTGLFLYIQGGKVYLIGGRGTTADAMMRSAGVENLATDLEDWENVGPEYTLSKNPDILIVATRGMESIDGAESLQNIPGIGELDAVSKGRIYIADDLAFLGFGPRVADELVKLFRYAYGLE